MNFALLALSTQLVRGPRALREAVKVLGESSVQKISAVYRRVDPKTDGSLAAEIITVLSITHEADLRDLQGKIKEAQKAVPTVTWRLLSFNHQVRLEPESPIPHPDLHMDPVILHCAAEVQGVFEHPVLGRSLQELVKSSQSSFGPPEFEFLLRGETLLGSNSLEVP